MIGYHGIWKPIFLILALIFFYAMLAKRESKELRPSDGKGLSLYVFCLYFVVIIWWTIPVFMTDIYSVIPQEIGGGKPRICRFDLASGAVSEQTRVLLTSDASTSAVLRTKLLPVIFAAGDSLYVRPETNWVAVKKEFVRAIDLNPVIEPVQPQPVDIEKMKNEVMHDMCTLPAFLWDMPLPQSTNTDESSGL